MKPARWLFGLSLCLALAALGAFLLARGRSQSEPQAVATADLDAAYDQMQAGRYERAWDIARRLVEADPANVDARFVVAECLMKDGRLGDALAAYDGVLAVKSADDEDRKIAHQCAGEILLEQGAVRQAERHFREALKRDPYFPPAHNRLAFLLGLEGRRWESLPHLVELIKQDEFSTFHLLLLTNPRQNIVVDDFLARAKQYDPAYAVPRLAEAKAAVERGQLDLAAEIAREIFASDSEQPEVKVLEGTIHLAREDAEAFVGWSRSLTLEQESHPDVWLLRARHARRTGETDVAIRCFAEAFFRDPNSLEACQSLAQLLAQHGGIDAKIVDYFKQRTQLLEHLDGISELLHKDQRNLKLMEQAFACCDWLERYWEAWGWCRAALTVDPNVEWAKSQEDEIEKHLVYDLPQTVIFKNVNEWDYSKFPLPAWRADGPTESAPKAGSTEPAIAFRELGADVGLDFLFEDGHEENPADKSAGRKMYEVTGGGVAAIDYDLDLFPDLYLGQGAKSWQASGNTLPDRLFRNLSGRRFEDVTRHCGIEELSYTQGIAAGDYDNDGFPDLYVANIGINRLYRNNGDGTFSEMASALPERSSDWTASVAIADIDRDGQPDLYDCTYLAEEAYEQFCETDEGYDRACNPRIFPALPDRVFISSGDGTFADRSDALPTEDADGRGLGVVIADYFGTGELQLFIANDMTANSFYVPERGTQPGELKLRDEALIRGLAFDHRGRAQACMGVAFGDFDGSGSFDLFVTNFFGDHNTLYLQEREIFTDLSHSSNLAALSYLFLGFGTQALDADLDGDLDLFVANGHIDDFSFQGILYRMRPQVLVNDGVGKFAELPPAQAGPYFSRELLGRGAAKLDWNRDGREDVVVSHLDDPAVLVANESGTRGEALRLSFVGTNLSRDAVGTNVEVIDGDDVRIAQVTAGSGYLASNENVLVVPVVNEGPVTVRVRWLGGNVAEFTGLAAGGHYRIVEGTNRPFLMP